MEAGRLRSRVITRASTGRSATLPLLAGWQALGPEGCS